MTAREGPGENRGATGCRERGRERERESKCPAKSISDFQESGILTVNRYRDVFNSQDLVTWRNYITSKQSAASAYASVRHNVFGRVSGVSE